MRIVIANPAGYTPPYDHRAPRSPLRLATKTYCKGNTSGVLAAALGHHRPAVVSDVGSLWEIVREPAP